MKNYVKWTILILIMAVISGCGERVDSSPPQSAQVSSQPNNSNTDQAKSDNNPISTSTAAPTTKTESNSNDSNNNNGCQRELESLGQFSKKEGRVDYKSGLRLFPLLHFILTKKSIPANNQEQSAFMKDNPIFITSNGNYSNSLLFATIHSKRTGVLHGVIGFPQNEVTKYYKPMIFGDDKLGSLPQLPSTDVGSANKLVHVNRQTWVNELAQYTKACKDTLILPQTQTVSPFFQYNNKIYPFSKEIDFVAGVEGVGFGLAENGNSYPGDRKIQIPILFYCPKCKVEKVAMIQNNVELKFSEDKYNNDWRKWLGKDWHMFLSEEIDFDEEVFAKAQFGEIHSALPPFISEDPSTIQVTIDGERVEYFNQ